MLAILIGAQCISLMTNEDKHLCMCFFVIHISSSMTSLFKSFPHLKLDYLYFLMLSSESSLQIPEASSLSDVYLENIFSLVCGQSFHSLNSVFGRGEVLNFGDAQFSNLFSFIDCVFGVILEKFLPNSKSEIFSFRSFIGLDFSLKCQIRFDLDCIILTIK